MLTLGIETSCDETSCAVLNGRDEIKSNVVSSSLFRHQPFGGVVPEIASRHCLEQIDFVFGQALKQADVKAEELDLIAVTRGPGLIGSLLVGVSFAKTLSYQLQVPLVGVNHLEAHLEACFISNAGKFGTLKERKKPAKFIGLLVSGGHTSISYHTPAKTVLLGETVDDAVGEAYDKVAKLMGLGYPGGPVIDRLAREGNPRAIPFTKPKQASPYDFSLSGIKTAVLYYLQKKEKEKLSKAAREKMKKDLAASFQHAVVSWIVEKTLNAAQDQKVKTVVVGGGVSANSYLREKLNAEASALGIKVIFPHLSLTSDNAAMIARLGVELYRRGETADLKLTGDPNLFLTCKG